MSWNDQIFSYCERGQNTSLWAEPFNAATNVAFLAAAGAALVLACRQPRTGPTPGVALLIGLVVAIGAGSFLFHTRATRWAALADVLPIGLFMVAYLGYALRVFLGLGWPAVLLGLALLAGAIQFADSIECGPGLFSLGASARGRCLNGTARYAPALAAMLVTGGLLQIRRHPAAGYLLAAGAIFLLSMVLRTVDIEACGLTRLGGRASGTHFLWHLLNAATLSLLLVAAVRHGRRAAA